MKMIFLSFFAAWVWVYVITPLDDYKDRLSERLKDIDRY